MKLRMTMATGVAIALLLVLSGCGKGTDDGSPDPAPGANTTSTPSSTPSSDGTVELTGDWHDTDAKWTVHFKADGTFVEDFEGINDFRVGTYNVDGDTVSLIGDDGNTDKGAITGETLVFRLGTLTRV